MNSQKCQRLEIPRTGGTPFQGQILALPHLTPGGPVRSLLPGGSIQEARPRGEAVARAFTYHSSLPRRAMHQELQIHVCHQRLKYLNGS